MDVFPVPADAPIPNSDAPETTTNASQPSANTRQEEGGSPVVPKKISTEQIVEMAAQLEALSTTAVVGTDEVKDHLQRVTNDMMDNNMDAMGDITGANAAANSNDDTKTMVTNIAKLLAIATTKANIDTGMRETAGTIAKDKDVAASARPLCTMCLQPGVNFCNGCQQARYCSAACQRADWPIHKQLCKAFAGGTETNHPRPSPSHHRALYLSYETNKMDLIWVDCHEPPEPTELIKRESIEHPDLEKFTAATKNVRDLGGANKYTFMNLAPALIRSLVPHALLGFSLIFDNDKELIHPTMINQTINGLASPGHLSFWFGPMVVFACDPGDGKEPSGRVVKDVAPRDVRHAVDFFTNNHNNPCIPYPDRFPIGGELVEKQQVQIEPKKTDDEPSTTEPAAKKPKKKKNKKKPSSLTQEPPKMEFILPAVKISDTKERYNRAMGVTNPIEPVTIPLINRDQPSWAVTAAFSLGLRWYLRQSSPVSVKSNPFVRDAKSGILYPRWHTGDLRWLGHTTGFEADGQIYCSTADHHVGSVVVFHGHGASIDPLHVLAFNGYLDAAYVAKETPSAEGLRAHWAAMKRDAEKLGMPKRIARVPGPYKMEEKGDRHGPDWVCELPHVLEEAVMAEGVWEEVVRDFGKTSAGLLDGFSKVGKKTVGGKK
ncbi:hypothetical protein B0T16DRAFT_17756 [Cercophora newfieldiana]|uniref:MYND-type domain-containing protein n=1 Tax=Cercophora newfieldiana TaxID=92897 RepID=A0AA40D079_9PEZI|nr:hypothetical protein B0T16DRAFT_17756 [Cercophora newfieldiana]